ncbi:inorganic pyrophosphatase isoform X1 [Anthonomus grandis grandis]|uniref:inorganic pyrophosphatase isoform X1 n=1 Tax=Anthonomus grandis grandis TaxID=2921223 RepID=UPI0021652ECF|nr:inorganic pyrophosphatase isoform X1 [Anthonomus grandis grandis]
MMLSRRLAHVLFDGFGKNLCKLSVDGFPSLVSVVSGVFNSYSTMPYSVIERGSQYAADYRVYIQDENGPISPLHDIPLVVDADKKVFNMVVEVPRWTNAKMEITMKEILNPIKQDVKKDKPRFVANCFPHHGYIWNYGALPQTWENPEHLDDGTGCKGDNDPIDVIEIGYRVAKRGEILQVKILGTIALIDEGETDWKLIAIDVNDPSADQINDVADVEKHFPGLLKASVEWFKIYKIPDGKPENQFAFNGEAKPASFAHKIIEEVHGFWKALVSKEVDAHGISCVNTTLDGNSFKISTAEAKDVVNKSPESAPPQPLEPIVDKIYFMAQGPGKHATCRCRL